MYFCAFTFVKYFFYFLDNEVYVQQGPSIEPAHCAGSAVRIYIPPD